MFVKCLPTGKICVIIRIIMKVALTQGQENAKNLISEWYFNSSEQVFVLSGYAGTGKTFLIDYMVKKVLKLEAGKDVVFVSPTGKAAANLLKKGTPASTVHSLIYMLDIDAFDVDEDGEVHFRDELHFVRRDEINSNIKLIIIDEASMVNLEMLNDLLSFGVKCLFCGDEAQLPPITGTCGLLERANCRLTEIVRQAADNPIIQVATMAREGQLIPYGNYGDKVCVIRRSSLNARDRKRLFLEADQILCGRNLTRRQLNQEIRAYKGIPMTEVLPLDGEKVICTLNDWEKALDREGRFHLVNGIIGTVSNVQEFFDDLGALEFQADFLQESVRVPFDAGIFTKGAYSYTFGRRAVTLVDNTIVSDDNDMLLRKLKTMKEEPICRFEFAYAITCHKAQGSEFDFVVVFDESLVFGEEKNRWLYTAITRAKEKLLIIR